jgi:UDP-GlcNAc3NAcA epimerase
MKTKTIIFIVGIRSQFIKLASIQRAILKLNSKLNNLINPIYINTGQHYDHELAQQFIKELDVNFHYTFKYEDKDPYSILGAMQTNLINCINDIKNKIHIDGIVVFGDANSTLAGAIAASRVGIPLIHVEAGVRTGDKSSPEEINRIVADHIARIHFVSSRIDNDNLIKEGIINSTFYSGDIVYDLVLDLSKEIGSGFREYKSEYILCTIHREENLKSPSTLTNLLRILSQYNRKVIFVTHPRTYQILLKLNIETPNITFVQGMQYKELLSTIKGCQFIITDSGALQREAFYLKKHCLIRQDIAFWQSLTKAGIHKTFDNTVESLTESLEWIEKKASISFPNYTDFGEGNAATYILNKIITLI